MSTTTGTSPALDLLRLEERALVLDELLRRNPDLRVDAEQAAIDQLREATAEDVAGRVAKRLRDLGLDDLAGRVGRVPSGYVDETEAACELVLEAVRPFEEDLRRCISLGLVHEAERTLRGLVAGLRRFETPADGTVVAYAGCDTLVEHADWLMAEARRSGVEVANAEGEPISGAPSSRSSRIR